MTNDFFLKKFIGDNRYYSDKYRYVYCLDNDVIFVFGSNEAGRHGLGAAQTALKRYGALYGQGYGLQGRSFGIPTKDKYICTLSLSAIKDYIDRFKNYITDECFFITAIGTGLAGYKTEDIAPMFKGVRNCYLPESWKPYIEGDEQMSETDLELPDDRSDDEKDFDEEAAGLENEHYRNDDE